MERVLGDGNLDAGQLDDREQAGRERASLKRELVKHEAPAPARITAYNCQLVTNASGPFSAISVSA